MQARMRTSSYSVGFLVDFHCVCIKQLMFTAENIVHIVLVKNSIERILLCYFSEDCMCGLGSLEVLTYNPGDMVEAKEWDGKWYI